jgi:hypothetical protein
LQQSGGRNGSLPQRNHLTQIEFANRELVHSVDSILAGPRPAVIVIHSDEDPWPSPFVGNEHGLGSKGENGRVDYTSEFFDGC